MNLQKSSTTTIHKVQAQKNSTVQRRLKFFNLKNTKTIIIQL